MNIVSEFLEKVTTIVESTAATNAAKVAQAISPTFFAAIALYVIYLIYEITYAQRDILMNEVTKNIGAFALVGAFTYSAPYYSQFVIPFVMHAGSDLSAAVTGGSGTATSVDNLWNALSTNLNNFLDTSMSIYGKFQIAEKMGVYLVWDWLYRRNASHLLHYCFLDTINFHGWNSSFRWHFIHLFRSIFIDQKYVYCMGRQLSQLYTVKFIL